MIYCIPLYPLDSGLVTLVDREDFEWAAAVKWYAMRTTARHTYANNTALVEGITRGITLHRAILEAPDDMWVDHIDRNGLNNRRSNIRLCTPMQNAGNRQKNKTNRGKPSRAPYKGVHRDDRFFAARWTARLAQEVIGSFDTAEEAAVAYDEASRIRYGPFARVNFPRQGEQAA